MKNSPITVNRNNGYLCCVMFFSKNGCLEGTIQRLKTYKDPLLKFEIKVRNTVNMKTRYCSFQ